MCSSDLAAITLVQSNPKGSNMDWIVQKAVEMGVSRIIPVITERTIVRLNEKEAVAKQLKWKRTALEACKQCGQNILPEIDVPRPFALAIGQSTSDMSIVAALVPGVKPIRDVLETARTEAVKNASLLVGPEGDLTNKETSMALEAGYVPVTFGDIVLRVETASFFSLTCIRYALD